MNSQFIVKLYGDQSASIIPTERRDRVFGAIDRAAYHQVEPRFGAKQTRDVKRENAIAEMAESGRRAAAIGRDLHRAQAAAAVPDSGETRGAKDFPTMRVGDAQRQATVG